MGATGRARRRRADAERNEEAILDAAVEVLPDNPAASIGDIATAAGLARQTLYAHYASREALLRAVAERARDETLAAIDASEPQRGAPADALDRLVVAWWSGVSRHALVLQALAVAYKDHGAIHGFHAPILGRLNKLIERGQRCGDFDASVSARWLASSFLALVHATADEISAGELDAEGGLAALTRAVPRLFGVTRG